MIRPLPFLATATLSLLIAGFAGCSSSDGGGSTPTPGDDASTPDGTTPPPGTDGSVPGTDGGGGSDGSAGDGGDTDAASDAGADATLDAGADAGPPAVRFVGRFDTRDATGPRMAWPGSRVIARFDGTDATVKLTQVDGFSGGPSYFNVIVDGAVGAPITVTGVSQDYAVAAGLAAGTHVVEIEKRTEANLGTVRFEGFTFQGGAGLLPPPAAPARRIEVLGDSTIDGFGVEGNVNNTCMNDAPPQFHNVRQGMAFKVASTLGADLHLMAYSGKGVFRNEDRGDNQLFELLYGRTLPEDGTSVWSFAGYTPDAVVIALGGADYTQVNGDAAPSEANVKAKYDALVGKVRTAYPNAYIFCTVWSQIKDDGAPAGYTPRTSLTNILNGAGGVVTTRKAGGDAKIFFHLFAQAAYPQDETGCYYHANDAHHTAKAAELVTVIKNATGW